MHLTIPFDTKVDASIDKCKREGRIHSVHCEECLFTGIEVDLAHDFILYSVTLSLEIILKLLTLIMITSCASGLARYPSE